MSSLTHSHYCWWWGHALKFPEFQSKHVVSYSLSLEFKLLSSWCVFPTLFPCVSCLTWLLVSLFFSVRCDCLPCSDWFHLVPVNPPFLLFNHLCVSLCPSHFVEHVSEWACSQSWQCVLPCCFFWTSCLSVYFDLFSSHGLLIDLLTSPRWEVFWLTCSACYRHSLTKVLFKSTSLILMGSLVHCDSSLSLRWPNAAQQYLE